MHCCGKVERFRRKQWIVTVSMLVVVLLDFVQNSHAFFHFSHKGKRERLYYPHQGWGPIIVVVKGHHHHTGLGGHGYGDHGGGWGKVVHHHHDHHGYGGGDIAYTDGLYKPGNGLGASYGDYGNFESVFSAGGHLGHGVKGFKGGHQNLRDHGGYHHHGNEHGGGY